MANTSVIVGVLLGILGVYGYFGAPADHRSLTAFIPAGFGLVLIVLGVLAFKDARRKHAMHAAAAVGLIGFLLAAGRFCYKLSTPEGVAGLGGMSTGTMAILCGAFVAMCVKSFIDVRRRRKADEAASKP